MWTNQIFLSLFVIIVHDYLFSTVVGNLVVNIEKSLKMSQRSGLHDSVRWWAIGCLEMGLSQVDATKCFIGSRNVVLRMCNQFT